MTKHYLTLVLFFFSFIALADTPAPPTILNLKGGSADGAITAHAGIVSSVAPGASGNVLISNGTTWTSSPGGGGSVDSVNGQTGVVVLTTDNISEGTTNLYFTTARARASTTATAPMSYASGVISITKADGTTDGYLSFTDWLTFNGKQPAGAYLTGLTGDVTATGPGNAAATVQFVGGASAASVASTVTTVNARTAANAPNTIVSRDSGGNFSGNNILAAGDFIGNLSGNADTATLAGNVTGVVTIPHGGTGQTTANAGLNALLPSQTGNATKFLQTDGANTSWQTAGSGSGTVTTVTATAPLSVTSPTTTPNISMTQSDATHSGYLSFTDWLTFNGKEPAITSGTTAQYWRGDKTFQTLNTTVVPEGTNLYYTDTRARAANSGTAPVSYNTSTGVISMHVADATHDGYLSSTDWNTFNSNSGGITQLTGDVTAGPGTGSQAATVALVGGVTAANVATGANAANTASSSPVANAIVKYDPSAVLNGNLNGNITGTASNVTGVVAIANGGSGQSNQQAAINNLTNIGAGTNGQVFTLFGGNAQWVNSTPVVGTPFTLGSFDATGALISLPSWSLIQPWNGMASDLLYDSPDNVNTTFNNYQVRIENTVPAPSANAQGYGFNMLRDFSGNNQDFGNVTLLNNRLTVQGNGNTNNVQSLSTDIELGDGTTTGTANGGQAIENTVTVATGYHMQGDFHLLDSDINVNGQVDSLILYNGFLGGAGSVQNPTALNLGMQVTSILGNLTMANLNNNSAITGNYNGIFVNSDSSVGANASMIGSQNNGAVTGNLNMFNAYNSNIASVGGDFRQLQLGNDAPVAGYSAGSLVNQNGSVGRGWTGYGSYLSANGGATNDNAIMFDGSYNNNTPTTWNGDVWGFNTFMNSAQTITGRVHGLNVSVNAPSHDYDGISMFHNANVTDESQSIQINDTSDSRTKTGVDIFLQGAATADVQALRINVNNQTSTSTSNHVQAIESQGGTVGFQSSVVPFNNVGVDIGNNFTNTIEIASGSPITGTDIISTLIQNNLILHDTIGAGPFGLGVNGTGIVNQIAFDSGVTQPLYRNFLVGTTVPQGAGGTLDTWVDMELIGLSSFGGSITNNYRIGIQDAQLVGQNWCDSVSIDCWFMRVRDARAENLLGRLAINTTSQKVSPGVRLELNDGHFKSTQTVVPTVTVIPGNAGAGATCSFLQGNDKRGKIQVTPDIGALTGPYCTVTFNTPYNSAPICMLTAASSPAAIVYPVENATTLDVAFDVAGVAATSYVVNYDCEETN